MSEKPFVAGIHHVTKAMADVEYPITKKELMAKVGSKEVQLGWNEKKTMKQLIEPLKLDKFESAASFFNALAAELNRM